MPLRGFLQAAWTLIVIAVALIAWTIWQIWG